MMATQLGVGANKLTGRTVFDGALCGLLCFLLFLLPVDWFEFTGVAFREAGAKPAILVTVVIAFMTMTMRHQSNPEPDLKVFVARCFIVMLYSGILAFLVNLLLGWSGFRHARSPMSQFFNQTGLLALFTIAVYGLMRACAVVRYRQSLYRFLPIAAVLHLVVFAAEATGIVSDSSGWLVWFRSDGGAIERATGLTSEPSYFGALAALLGMPLLLLDGRRRLLRVAIGLALLAGAFNIQAKTVFVVLIFQIAGFAIYGRRLGSARLIGALAIPVSALAIWMVATTAATNLEENLSSIMRLGSNVLAVNVSSQGFGFTGVGFGQFHFFYLERFSPDFLFASPEAWSQFDPAVDLRASTFNLWLRILVETGLIGLFAFAWLLHRSLRKAGKSQDRPAQFGLLLISGSVGFLMTQDTYFYPPLALGLALALTAPEPIEGKRLVKR